MSGLLGRRFFLLALVAGRGLLVWRSMLLHSLLLLFVFLFHLLRLLLMTLFHLLLPLRRSALLRRSLMFLLLPLLQLRVFLVLLLRQSLLLLLVFLIAICFRWWRAVLWQLRRVAGRRPVICFQPAVCT